jgi:hypothetical protein
MYKSEERLLNTAESGQRIEMNGDTNAMVFYNDEGIETCRIDDSIDSGQAGSPLGGLRAVTPTGNASFISGNGVFSNGSGMAFISATAGIQTNASVVGLLRTKNVSSNGLSSAIVGVDQSTTGNSQSFAGYFQGATAMYGAQYVKVRIISADDNVQADDYYIVNNGGNINLALPLTAKSGRMLIIHNRGVQTTLNVTFNGSALRAVTFNQCYHFIYVGTEWLTMPATG